MAVTNEILYEKLKRLEVMVESLLRQDVEASLEEVSLYKASRLLKASEKTVIKYIEAKLLPARKIETNRTKEGYTYRVKVDAIKQFLSLSETICAHTVKFDPKKIIGIRS